MRKVMVSVFGPDGIKEEKGIATFQNFGLDFKQCKDGLGTYSLGTYSVALIEWPGGTVESVSLSSIRFLESLD